MAISLLIAEYCLCTYACVFVWSCKRTYSESSDSGPSENWTLYYKRLSTVDNPLDPKIMFPYSSNAIWTSENWM